MAEDLVLWFLEQFEKNPEAGHSVKEIAEGIKDSESNVRPRITRLLFKGDVVIAKKIIGGGKRYKLNPQSANRIRLNYGREVSMRGI